MTAANQDNQMHWKDRKHILWFPWTFTKYYIMNDRLTIEKGLLKTVVDETLLYRIVDITMEQTLAGKLFGTGTLIITAKADKTPEIRLENIAKPREIRQMLSQLVEESRNNRNVVGKEFYSGEYTVGTDTDESDDDFDDEN
ncbi:MAG: PH domain-containing protein [Lachnospiraceae bacterium]|jgi:uncharacterized membrane protein YdbT with pleckstrin-like domain